METKDRSEGSSGKNNENKAPLTVDQINSDRITQVHNLKVLHQIKLLTLTAFHRSLQNIGLHKRAGITWTLMLK